MRLDLTFEYHPPSYGRSRASFGACQGLLSNVSTLLAPAGHAFDVSAEQAQGHMSGSDPIYELTTRKDLVQHLISAPVYAFTTQRLHYGSPFEIEVIIGGGSALVSMMGLLMYGLKRIWGFDYELMAYRERQRAEWLKAKQLADKLAEAEPHALSEALESKVPPDDHWWLSGADFDEFK